MDPMGAITDGVKGSVIDVQRELPASPGRHSGSLWLQAFGAGTGTRVGGE